MANPLSGEAAVQPGGDQGISWAADEFEGVTR
jgi:hypothetical protein